MIGIRPRLLARPRHRRSCHRPGGRESREVPIRRCVLTAALSVAAVVVVGAATAGIAETGGPLTEAAKSVPGHRQGNRRHHHDHAQCHHPAGP